MTTVPNSSLPKTYTNASGAVAERTPTLLAKPLIWDGRPRAAGDVVWLRPEDLVALDKDGYLEAAEATLGRLAEAGTALVSAQTAWWRARDTAIAAGATKGA